MGTVTLYRFTAVDDTVGTAESIVLDSSTNPNSAGAIIDKDGFKELTSQEIKKYM